MEIKFVINEKLYLPVKLLAGFSIAILVSHSNMKGHAKSIYRRIYLWSSGRLKIAYDDFNIRRFQALSYIFVTNRAINKQRPGAGQ